MPPIVTWSLPPPSQKKFPDYKARVEAFMISVTPAGFDEVVIRQLPHNTTKINGARVVVDEHITAYFVKYNPPPAMATPAHVYCDTAPQLALMAGHVGPNPELFAPVVR